jgi:hypothetical protein
MRGVTQRPGGLTYRTDFVDEGTEQELLAFVSTLAPAGHHPGQHVETHHGALRAAL